MWTCATGVSGPQLTGFPEGEAEPAPPLNWGPHLWETRQEETPREMASGGS